MTFVFGVSSVLVECVFVVELVCPCVSYFECVYCLRACVRCLCCFCIRNMFYLSNSYYI